MAQPPKVDETHPADQQFFEQLSGHLKDTLQQAFGSDIGFHLVIAYQDPDGPKAASVGNMAPDIASEILREVQHLRKDHQAHPCH